MELYDAENATRFDTKVECESWISDRVVRFKLKVVHGKDQSGNFALGTMQKSDGRIVVMSSDEFKLTSLDEPLANYAFALEQEDKTWLAVMGMGN
jgi:hypothetical protein